MEAGKKVHKAVPRVQFSSRASRQIIVDSLPILPKKVNKIECPIFVARDIYGNPEK